VVKLRHVNRHHGERGFSLLDKTSGTLNLLQLVRAQLASFVEIIGPVENGGK